MRRQDALRLEADARDMVEALPEGVSVPWHTCIRVRDHRIDKGALWVPFQINTSDLAMWEQWRLAIGIVENQPAFIDDVLYHKASGRKVEVFEKAGLKGSIATTTMDINKSVITGMAHEFTWQEPEQTITFTQRTLPMPDAAVREPSTAKGYPVRLIFRTKQSANEWFNMLNQFLQGDENV